MKRITLLLIALGIGGAWVAVAASLLAAQTEPEIVVTLEWLNHAEMQCRGCSTQRGSIAANTWAVLAKDCGGKTVFVKVLSRWKGDSIEVTIATQDRKSDGKFVDREAQTALVTEGQSREVTLEGFKYRVSASKAPDLKKEPNTAAAQSGSPVVTPPAK